MKANLNKSKLLEKMNTIYFTETQTLAANLQDIHFLKIKHYTAKRTFKLLGKLVNIYFIM